MPSALPDAIPLMALASHGSNVRYEFIWTQPGCAPLFCIEALFLTLLIYLLNHLIKHLLTVGPQSRCGHCYCNQASKTVMFCVSITD